MMACFGFSKAIFRVMALLVLLFFVFASASTAPATSPVAHPGPSYPTPPPVSALAPAPSPSPNSDGTSIDQGIAYVLMLVALVLTYLIHPLDAMSYSFF